MAIRVLKCMREVTYRSDLCQIMARDINPIGESNGSEKILGLGVDITLGGIMKIENCKRVSTKMNLTTAE